jgi:GDPmannose 4,6-dehydratase
MNSKNLQETLYNKKIDTMNILNINDARQYKGKINIIVSGCTGQDGSHMVDYLLKNTDAIIFGGVRRLSVYNHENIKHINNERFHLINFDLSDSHAISRIVEVLQPDYFINFAAQSFVASSWDFARQTWQINSTGVLDCLEAIRQYAPNCRFYNAGSSEEFGNVEYSPQDEKHPLKPRSPYGSSKAAARQLVKVYRESYNLYAVQGWLFNHEGERRGEEFVTRKIVMNVARISKELKDGKVVTPIELGNVNARRDWSYAPDFMDGVWRMLNQENYRKDIKEPLLMGNGMPIINPSMMKRDLIIPKLKEYVLASGENHTIREFVEEAFKVSGVYDMWDTHKPHWVGEGLNERYVMGENDCVCLVKINPKFYRPAEVDTLLGDPTLVKTELGWSPKVGFKELVKIMTESELNKIKN